MVVDVILGGVLPLLLLIISGYLVVRFRDERVLNLVKIAVRAAEQLFEHGMNAEKFDYVKKWISKKFKISETDLKNIIESAVYELKSLNKETGGNNDVNG